MRIMIAAAVAALTVNAAVAADLGGKTPAPAPVEEARRPFSGCYGGVNGDVAGSTEVVGVDLGCDYSVNGRVVVGGLGRFSHATDGDNPNSVSVLGRIGFLVNPALMLYGTAGPAYNVNSKEWAGIAGAGIETFVAPSLTIYAEGDRYFSGADGTMVIGGIRYRFGGSDSLFGK